MYQSSLRAGAESRATWIRCQKLSCGNIRVEFGTKPYIHVFIAKRTSAATYIEKHENNLEFLKNWYTESYSWKKTTCAYIYYMYIKKKIYHFYCTSPFRFTCPSATPKSFGCMPTLPLRVHSVCWSVTSRKACALALFNESANARIEADDGSGPLGAFICCESSWTWEGRAQERGKNGTVMLAGPKNVLNK